MAIRSFDALLQYLTLSVYDDVKKELHVYFTLSAGCVVDARLLIKYLSNPQFKDTQFLSGTVTNTALIAHIQQYKKASAFSGS